MPRSLYSPKLSDDLLRQSLGSVAGIQPALQIREEEPEKIPIRKSDAA